MARRDIVMIKQFPSSSSSSNKSSISATATATAAPQPQNRDAHIYGSPEASGLSGSCSAVGAGGCRVGSDRAGAGTCDNSDYTISEHLKSPTITIGPCTSSSSTTITNIVTTSESKRIRNKNYNSIKYKQRRQLSFNTEPKISDQQHHHYKLVDTTYRYDNLSRQHSTRLTLPSSSNAPTSNASARRNEDSRKKQQAANSSRAIAINADQSQASSQPRLRPISPALRYPNLVSPSQRLQAQRMSLLGKPIYLSSHKSKYRNTPSMRWKMRLRSFLEQPQGLFPWLYHFSL